MKGESYATDQEMNLGVDASFLATGISQEENGAMIEDACWLYPDNDSQHINLAELDTLIKCINLAFQWQVSVSSENWFLEHVWLTQEQFDRQSKSAQERNVEEEASNILAVDWEICAWH